MIIRNQIFFYYFHETYFDSVFLNYYDFAPVFNFRSNGFFFGFMVSSWCFLKENNRLLDKVLISPGL